MAAGICDIDHRRPATHKVRLRRNGRDILLELCDIDYARLRQQQAMASPFESLFRAGNDPFNLLSDDFPAFSSELGYPIPRDREATGLEDMLSEHTKELVQQAAEVAVNIGRQTVDTEHLLYALLDSDVVAEILRTFKVKPDELKQYLDAHMPSGDFKPDNTVRAEVDVSPRVKAILELAFGIARSLGHGYIGPEHLLIALIQEDQGMAGEVLRKYGLTPESVRQRALSVVGLGAGEGTIGPPANTPQLDKYSRDLSALAKEGKLDPVIGRAEEIETTIEILSRRTKNNPALIGEPGVGKTAIVEGLAQRIATGRVPQILSAKRVVEVNLNSIVAGSKYRGEFEERIKAVLDEITAHSDELIVFIDELHAIVGAGATEGGLDIANTIKPALARGELHLIGATTLGEYQRHIEKDAALERRFQPVFIPEPTVEQTIEILRGLRDRYEAHHKVKITDEAIVAASQLSDRYITSRFLPDKAIYLIDQAASRVRIGADTVSRDIDDLDEQIASAKRELEYATNHRDFERAKTLEREHSDLETRKTELTDTWRRERGSKSPEVTAGHVAAVVARLTGIPVAELTEEERDKLLRMEDRLHERVIGQHEAIQAISDAIRLSRAGLTGATRPTGSFIFLGPTGVGKTELAKSLAWLVFGSENALIRIDMTEYMERHTVARLIGAPPGYVGYEEGGQLTERVRRRPHSVILLDEIEKAHPDVANILLQVLDDGRLTDGKGRVTDFTNTIIIATSNIGSHLIQDQLTRHEEDRLTYDQLKEQLMEQLRLKFRPEFLNRIDEIIIFRALDRAQIKAIVELQLEALRRSMRGEGIDLTFDNSVIDHLAEAGYVPEFGARYLRRLIRAEIQNPLARQMLSGDIREGIDLTAYYDSASGLTFEAQAPAETPATQELVFREEIAPTEAKSEETQAENDTTTQA